MDTESFKVLEYEKIKTRLASYAATAYGKERCSSIMPSSDYDHVALLHRETEEAVRVAQIQPPFDGIHHLQEILKKAGRGILLELDELRLVKSTIGGMRDVKYFFRDLSADAELLKDLARRIEILGMLERNLKAAIDEYGNFRDDASPVLHRITNELRTAQSRVKDRLSSILHDAAYQKMFQEAIVTVRDERYVIPVKQEYRSQFPGVIHDQSASGATLFIEPLAIVELNNTVRQMGIAREQEILRIMQRLTGEIARSADVLSANCTILSDLDLIFARASLAREMRAYPPILNKDGYVHLQRARHPLLPPDKVVPIDIELGKTFSTLLITGPNTGGKTVSMKTLGILALMTQSGCFLPAESGSEIPVYQNIYADIGDEQSIEQSLSTFSSHMTNIVSILNQVTDRSLVLFDELGSGTDPQEGALLAMAILNHLRKIGTLVMATTHYPELKLYAHETANTLNASMEFDAQTLSPTYRLLLGVPGRSNAFDISGRLGLDPSILEEARQGIKEDSQALNDMVAKLEEERRQAELDHEAAQELLEEAQQLHADLRHEYNRWLEAKERLQDKAKQEANAKVAQAQAQAEALIQEIRDLQLEQGQNQTIKEHVLIEKRAGFEQLKQPENLKKNKVLKKAKNNRQLKVGDDVEVLSYGQRGTIIEVKGKEYIVQMGILKMKFEQEELEPLNQVETKTKVNVHRQAGAKVQTSLDLRGERYEQALYRLRQYLDAALLSNHPMVTIIHGKGTGALRQGVKEVLAKHPQVDRFEYSPANAGGNGSTIVYFK